jgi:hypothetical protein
MITEVNNNDITITNKKSKKAQKNFKTMYEAMLAVQSPTTRAVIKEQLCPPPEMNLDNKHDSDDDNDNNNDSDNNNDNDSDMAIHKITDEDIANNTNFDYLDDIDKEPDSIQLMPIALKIDPTIVSVHVKTSIATIMGLRLMMYQFCGNEKMYTKYFKKIFGSSNLNMNDITDLRQWIKMCKDTLKLKKADVEVIDDNIKLIDLLMTEYDK